MTNAGLSDPSGAIIYLILLLIPAFLSIFVSITKYFIVAIPTKKQSVNSTIDQYSYFNSSPVITKCSYKNKFDNIKKKKKAKKDKVQQEETVQTKTQITQTSNEIKQTVKLALIKTGFKSKDAKELIEKLCINKYYVNESDLIMDCFAKK